MTTVMTTPRFVYVLERDGLLKIGCSENPRRRARELRGVLLGFTAGGFSTESRLHRHFGEHAIGKEWFNDVTAIRALAADWGLPAVPALPLWMRQETTT